VLAAFADHPDQTRVLQTLQTAAELFAAGADLALEGREATRLAVGESFDDLLLARPEH
jgi:hypothetical protein